MLLPQDYLEKMTLVKSWIRNTLASHHSARIRMTDLNFRRLPSYFEEDTLQNTYVIYTDKIPVFPFEEMNLPLFPEMNSINVAGITYMDSFFALDYLKKDEVLHFHELIHTIQWKLLGAEKFLELYAIGLIEHGYRMSPLERMAYDLQDYFRCGKLFKAETEITRGLKTLKMQ